MLLIIACATSMSRPCFRYFHLVIKDYHEVMSLGMPVADFSDKKNFVDKKKSQYKQVDQKSTGQVVQCTV